MPASPVQLEQARRVHMVGIGGSGMASLASLLAGIGLEVSGSDRSGDAATRLRERGFRAEPGHHAAYVDGAEIVIASAAVPEDNPELVEARCRGLRVLSHAEALGELMRSRSGIAVAGTHGKTTTTAMLGYVLARAGLDPMVLAGSVVLNFGSGARVGRGKHLVVEADEYARRFLTLSPELAIITGIEADHLDYFRDLEEIVGAFVDFATRVKLDGVLVTSADDRVLTRTPLPGNRTTYGLASDADWRLGGFTPRPGGGCSFEIQGPSGHYQLALRLNGLHNAANATAVFAAATSLGVPPELAVPALADFEGTERRFQTLAASADVWIVDDYAHHPTAVRATLQAARQIHGGRLWAVFQPHTSNRLAALLDEFAASFEQADLLTIVPVYQASGRESGDRPVGSADLAGRIRRPPTILADSLSAAEQQILTGIRPGDLVLVMGAGDVTLLSHRLAAAAGIGSGRLGGRA